jgi:hypothetical protein
MSSDYDPSRGHTFTVKDGVIVVEYYHFGEDVAYEFAEEVRLAQTGQEQMAKLLGLTDIIDSQALAQVLKEKFVTYYAVRDFADENGVAYEHSRDLWP